MNRRGFLGALAAAPFVAPYISTVAAPHVAKAAITETVIPAGALPQVFAFILVTGDVPDVSEGEEGQFAVKLDASPWKVWQRIGGEWLLS